MNGNHFSIRLKAFLASLLVCGACVQAAPFMHGQSNPGATSLDFIQAAGQETLAQLADGEATGQLNGAEVARPVLRLPRRLCGRQLHGVAL